MALARHRLSQNSRIEREVVALLRSTSVSQETCVAHARGCRLAQATSEPLSALAVSALAAGYSFRPVAAPHISKDELRLVGWLALLQRERSDDPVIVDPVLLDELKRCATALKNAGFRLPYQAVLRAGFIIDGQIGSAGRDDEQPRPLNSLSAKAVAYARERGCVPTQAFGEIGVSRQHLSKLCRNGALLRVRHGFYRAPTVQDRGAELATAPMRSTFRRHSLRRILATSRQIEPLRFRTEAADGAAQASSRP